MLWSVGKQSGESVESVLKSPNPAHYDQYQFISILSISVGKMMSKLSFPGGDLTFNTAAIKQHIAKNYADIA